jgi:hypothetical protein
MALKFELGGPRRVVRFNVHRRGHDCALRYYDLVPVLGGMEANRYAIGPLSVVSRKTMIPVHDYPARTVLK